MRFGFALSLLLVALVMIGGCGKKDGQDQAKQANGKTQLRLQLNWFPEPEFGGIYQARDGGAFAKHGLDVEILPGGQNVDPQKMLVAENADAAVLAADQILAARAQGLDIVAVFAIYQDNPQGIMVHKAAGFKNIGDVFKANVKLAVQPQLPYVKLLQKKYAPIKADLVQYNSNVGLFLEDPNYAQQCFVTSEPVAAELKGGDPQAFLIAEEGYNPYAGVIAVRGDYLKQNPQVVKELIAALRDGWREYQDHPESANAAMLKLNTSGDAKTFALAAEKQKSLIENDETKKSGIGAMSRSRWEKLEQQLRETGDLQQAVNVDQCFQTPPAP